MDEDVHRKGSKVYGNIHNNLSLVHLDCNSRFMTLRICYLIWKELQHTETEKFSLKTETEYFATIFSVLYCSWKLLKYYNIDNCNSNTSWESVFSFEPIESCI